MNGLHGLVMAGKVFYLVSHTPSYLCLHPLNAIPLAQGISDAPAWIVSRANQYARDHGKTPFSIYQGQWNVMMRDLEREVIPMARAEGMALAPWNVLGAGKIRSDAEEARRRETGENGRAWHGPWERTEDEKKVCAALEKVAEEVGAKSIGAGEHAFGGCALWRRPC